MSVNSCLLVFWECRFFKIVLQMILWILSVSIVMCWFHAYFDWSYPPSLLIFWPIHFLSCLFSKNLLCFIKSLYCFFSVQLISIPIFLTTYCFEVCLVLVFLTLLDAPLSYSNIRSLFFSEVAHGDLKVTSCALFKNTVYHYETGFLIGLELTN